MASVSSPAPNSISMLPRNASASGRWQMIVVMTALLLVAGVISGRHHLGTRGTLIEAAGMTLLACCFWFFHLHAGGLPGAWCFLFCLLQAGQWMVWLQHRPRVDAAQWQGALGCAAFAYAMLWVFKVHDRDSGLRALATAALLLSIGILAKPPVLICCALLSLAVFLGDRRRLGGVLHSVLLLLTPVALSLLAIALLHAFAVQGVAQLAWTVSTRPLDSAPLHLSTLAHDLPGLSFCAAVLTARLLMRKSDSPDLAFLFLLVFLPTLGMAPFMPEPMSALEVSLILSWGAAALLALDPPLPVLSRLVALGGASLSLWFCR